MGNGYHGDKSAGIDWLRVVTLTLCALHSVRGTQNFDYEWRTGPWGDCEHTECGFGGSRTRTVWCSHKTGWTTLFSHCHFLPKPRDTELCYKVCESGRTEVTWVTSLWSPCRRDPAAPSCVRLTGSRDREVRCIHVSTDKVLEDSVCAFFHPKPPGCEKCAVDCPQDCVVSLFSPWSPCNGCFHMYSRRTRRVVVPPQHSGAPCPPLVETAECPNCTNTYRFQVNPWSPCLRSFQFKNPKKKERSHLLIGYQKRDILCVDSNGNTVGHRYCLDSLHLPDLRNVRSCTMPQDCQVSEWMEWQPINSSCLADNGTIIPGSMSRIRRVLAMPQGDGQHCPPLSNTFQVVGTASRLSPCPRYEWVTSEWSECDLLYQSRKRAEQCGPGIHTRVVMCLQKQDGMEIAVDSAFCAQPVPISTRRCHVHCTQNCTVSLWSDWSPCGDAQSCSSTQRIAHYRSRHRRVLEPMGGFGLPCPHLSESQPCTPSPCLRWNVTAAGACRPKGGRCGEGTQEVRVTCLDRTGSVVDNDRCLIYTRVHKPSSPVPCYLPCPNDCVVGDWSAWTRCSSKCGTRDPDNIRRRQRVVYAKAGPGGKACPPDADLSEIELCPSPPSCHTYIWQTSDWGTCRLVKPSLTCGSGVQSRSVQCYRVDNSVMPATRCSQAHKPSERRECRVPCPVPCRLTDWSGWTPCSVSCQPVAGSYHLAIETRRRYVIEEGREGGTACPPTLTDARPCSRLLPCTRHYWKLSAWSPCVLPPYYIYCGDGLRARTVRCQDDGGNETDPDFCLRAVGTMPPATETCSVTCDQDCRVSSWSSFSPCVDGCDGFRIRTRNLIGDSKDKGVCRNSLKYPLVEKELCRCADFKPVMIGDWSPCILDDSQSDQNVDVAAETKRRKDLSRRRTEKEEDNNLSAFLKHLSRFDLTTASSLLTNVPHVEPVGERFDAAIAEAGAPLSRLLGDVPGRPVVSRRRPCGMGTRYRLYACQSQVDTGVVEPAHNCSSRVYSEEVCLVPCPADCEMSGWSAWVPCSVSCGAGVQTRERHIIKHAVAGGRLCPDLPKGVEVESRVCSAVCRTNTWRVFNWSQCYAEGSSGVNTDVLCGVGVRTRNVECVKRSDFYGGTKDSDFFCRSEPHPSSRELCEIPCPGKCVVGDWSVWSQCSQCTEDNYRTRSRLVLRQPALPEDGCPPLIEEEPCMAGHSCALYNWTAAAWSSCILDEKAGDCGVGWRRRAVTCSFPDGTTVGDIKCLQLYGEPRFRDTEACNRTCDVNCAVSEWSPWSDCSRGCGLGELRRHRTVLYPAEGQGRVCPEDLVQTKQCLVKPCYSLVLSNWTTCELKLGACGHSVESRTVTCESESGTPVHIDRCAEQAVELPSIQTERPCSIPCPGECVVSDWSEWSNCHIDCVDYHHGDRQGVISRSRVVLFPPAPRAAPCPPLLEYLPCTPDQCYSFVWRKSPWQQGTRLVWCARSDGLNVTGGCDEAVRPAESLSCSPPCTSNHSVCVDSDLCSCESPYSPTYDHQRPPRLLECVMGLNGTKVTAAPALYLPGDGLTNFWMYAVLAAGSLFIIFVIVALYTIWRRDRKQKQQMPPEPSAATASGVSKSFRAGKSQSGRSPDATDTSGHEDPVETHLLSVPTDTGKNMRSHAETAGNTIGDSPADKPGSLNLRPVASPARPNGAVKSPEVTMEEPSETSVLLASEGPSDSVENEESDCVVTVDVHAECQTPGSDTRRHDSSVNNSCTNTVSAADSRVPTSPSSAPELPLSESGSERQAAPRVSTDSSGNSVDTGRGSSPTDRTSLDGVATLPRQPLSPLGSPQGTRPIPSVTTPPSPTNPDSLRVSVIPSNPVSNSVGDEDNPWRSVKDGSRPVPGDGEPAQTECVVIDQDSLDSDSDLPDSASSSVIKLPLSDSREHLAQIVTSV